MIASRGAMAPARRLIATLIIFPGPKPSCRVILGRLGGKGGVGRDIRKRGEGGGDGGDGQRIQMSKARLVLDPRLDFVQKRRLVWKKERFCGILNKGFALSDNNIRMKILYKNGLRNPNKSPFGSNRDMLCNIKKKEKSVT